MKWPRVNIEELNAVNRSDSSLDSDSLRICIRQLQTALAWSGQVYSVGHGAESATMITGQQRALCRWSALCLGFKEQIFNVASLELTR